MTDPSPTRQAPRSRPVFRQTIMLSSLQAQRVYNRCFKNRALTDALFDIDVILQHRHTKDEMEQVETAINTMLEQVSQDLDTAVAQFQKLAADNGNQQMVDYTESAEVVLEINCPQAAKFGALIKKLDDVICLIDTLWLTGCLTNKQRSDGTYQWQQRLIRLSGRIIAVQREARHATKERETEEQPVREMASLSASNEDLTDGQDIVTEAVVDFKKA